MKQPVDVRLDEISIDLPPDLEVDRDEYVAGLVEELTRLMQTQELPAAAMRDRELVQLQMPHTRSGDYRAQGREAARAIHGGLIEWT
ncbi:MAG TPA: hypothetical protein VGX27_14105 [Candidatus Dormibacteraeota bacterium]|nr:hypothetical protein [Candidatus Dormibacteraeota bacterium]